MRMTGVLDYGIGNIGSILNMVKKVGAQGMAVKTAEELSRCDRLILPGVGRFDAGMALLSQSGLRRALDRAVGEGVPLLGHLYIVLGIPLSWVPFAISELGQIPVFLSRLFPMGGEAAGVFAQDYLKYGSQYGWLLLLGILFSTPIPRRIYRQYAPKPWMPVVLVAIFLGCVYCIVRQGSDPFMYFQF